MAVSSSVPDVILRAYTPEDAHAVAAIFAHPECYKNTLQLPWENKVTPEISPEQGVMIVAEWETDDEKKVIGSANMIRSLRVPVSHVFGIGMAVHPDYHHQGVGSRLLEALITTAFEWYNAHRLQLEVFTYNHAAIRLYEKYGFAAEGIRKEAVFRQGRYVDLQVMALLNPNH
ncbi:L-amino acid N-acetyltransferase AaaT [Halomonadaceae bacterium LMG 33818]|uniref:GNAT family N-acetyltransferase n=1 Tax=Cernens ardua TaxID=3402176 RepID=UPI003EDCAE7E